MRHDVFLLFLSDIHAIRDVLNRMYVRVAWQLVLSTNFLLTYEAVLCHENQIWYVGKRTTGVHITLPSCISTVFAFQK